MSNQVPRGGPEYIVSGRPAPWILFPGNTSLRNRGLSEPCTEQKHWERWHVKIKIEPNLTVNLSFAASKAIDVFIRG